MDMGTGMDTDTDTVYLTDQTIHLGIRKYLVKRLKYNVE